MNKTFPPEVATAIRKHALLNAYRHRGEAKVSPVLSKVLFELPAFKSRVKELLPLVKEIVEEVNSLSMEEQYNILSSNWPELLEVERKQEVKGLPPLPNVDKFEMVRTRFAPNPDAPLHLGSARPIILCYEYAKMYNGHFILRFEDTDPKTKRPLPYVYDWIREDILWLGAKWDEEYIQSDRISIYYNHIKRLFELGGAYVCTCSREKFRKYKMAGTPCPCRSRAVEENLELWEKMVEGLMVEGSAVVRVKTEMSHPNPAIRDWVAFRIIDVEKWPHPRVGDKFWVWPTYNFACAIDDHELKISHILRGKEHMSNTVKQKYIYQYFGWSFPEAIHFGRLKLKGWVLSKSKIADGIRRGLFKSWDDPRLGTLRALRRRGFLPEAIREIILQVGVKPIESSISLENLYSINRSLIEPLANRYSFISDPVKLRITGLKKTVTARIPLHPSFPEKGFREIHLKPEANSILVYISGSDASSMKIGETYRLMGFLNFKVESLNGEVKGSFQGFTLSPKIRIIHWLPLDRIVKARIIMPDASIVEGFCDYDCKRLKIDDKVQFIRFGYVRVDDVNEPLTFYYTHP